MRKNKIELPYKLLIYDIETSVLLAYLFSLGEQRINHKQLMAAFNQTEIICIAAKWYGKDKMYVFRGDNAIEEFDKMAREADVCMGKNSARFDVKHINTHRMMQGLKPYPEWMDTNDDLEKQLRKHFAFPSQSLDYISSIMGEGGKEKMEFSDWVSIKNLDILNKLDSPSTNTCHVLFKKTKRQVISDGETALKKMIHYNKKDVLDTENILTRVLPYIKLRHNASTLNKKKGCTGCILCGSTKLVPTKIIVAGKTKYQQFDCLAHNGYGGRCTWTYNKNRNKVWGTMG